MRKLPSKKKMLGARRVSNHDKKAEQKRMIEIMGLERLSLEPIQAKKIPAKTSIGSANNNNNNNNNNSSSRVQSTFSVAKVDPSTLKMIFRSLQVGSFSLDSLPVVSSSMTEEELRSELQTRNQDIVVSDKSKLWLLDYLKVGTISTVKALEVVPADVIDEMPKVSSITMSEHQLRREFLHRHPFKKRLCRGKWKDWFVYQLGEGSICLAPMMSKPISFKSRRKSGGTASQASVSNTVSTAPTRGSACS